MKDARLLALGAGLIIACLNITSAQVPNGRVYVLHSKATGACPSMDWYVVVEENDLLSGMISWNDMKTMTTAIGTIDEQHHTFSIVATEISAGHLTIEVDGHVEKDGRLTADIRGPNINCSAVKVPIYIGGTDVELRHSH